EVRSPEARCATNGPDRVVEAHGPSTSSEVEVLATSEPRTQSIRMTQWSTATKSMSLLNKSPRAEPPGIDGFGPCDLNLHYFDPPSSSSNSASWIVSPPLPSWRLAPPPAPRRPIFDLSSRSC